jgi:hypothetical protein
MRYNSCGRAELRKYAQLCSINVYAFYLRIELDHTVWALNTQPLSSPIAMKDLHVTVCLTYIKKEEVCYLWQGGAELALQ